MQNQLLMKFVGLFIGSTLLKVLINMWLPGPVSMGLGVLVDAAFLACIYILLRNYRVPGARRIMIVLILLTLSSLLVEFGILSGAVGNILFLAIIAWMFFGKGGSMGRGRRF